MYKTPNMDIISLYKLYFTEGLCYERRIEICTTKRVPSVCLFAIRGFGRTSKSFL